MTGPLRPPGAWGLVATEAAGSGRDDVAALLRHALAVAWGEDPGGLSVGRSCPSCGSDAHGAPVIVGLPPGRRALVSLTRLGSAADCPVIAAWWAPPAGRTADGLGVDVEDPRSSAFDDDDGLGPLVWSPADRSWVDRWPPARRAYARARLWTRKEALVKAAGTGFTGDPSAVEATAHEGGAVVVDLPARALPLPRRVPVVAALAWRPVPMHSVTDRHVSSLLV